MGPRLAAPAASPGTDGLQFSISSQSGTTTSGTPWCGAAHPTPWTTLAPLPSTITPAHPARFAGIEGADLLDQVLYEINLGEDARRVE